MSDTLVASTNLFIYIVLSEMIKTENKYFSPWYGARVEWTICGVDRTSQQSVQFQQQRQVSDSKSKACYFCGFRSAQECRDLVNAPVYEMWPTE